MPAIFSRFGRMCRALQRNGYNVHELPISYGQRTRRYLVAGRDIGLKIASLQNSKAVIEREKGAHWYTVCMLEDDATVRAICMRYARRVVDDYRQGGEPGDPDNMTVLSMPAQGVL